MMLHEAIYSLYPEVVVIRGQQAFDKDGKEVVYDKDAVEALMKPKPTEEQLND